MTETSANPSRIRRLLLLSYWYPPAVGAAAERMFSFARTLPDFGWEIDILTAERTASPPELSGVSVHVIKDPLETPGPLFADYDPRQSPPRWKTLLRPFVFPDRFLKWQRAAYQHAQSLTSQRSYDILLATFPPASVMELALRLDKETDAKLVLDFRDRWIGPGGYEPTSDKQRRGHETMEREVIARASAITTVSEAMADALAKEQGFDREKIFIVPNGYEPIATASDRTSEPAISRPADDKITIAHVGTVIPRNRPDLFFEDMLRIQEDPRIKNVFFKFVGNLSADYIQDIGLSSIVQSTGLLPVDAARMEMQNADALLLLTGCYVGQWGYNAKLFEYVQTGRPILCLEESPGSNDRKLLERFIPHRSFFAPLDDAEALAEQIERIRDYLAQRSAAAMELDGAFRDYSRKAIAAKMASNLDALLNA